ncbi:AAA family ATPase, partial [Vibrio parahaemolyticus]
MNYYIKKLIIWFKNGTSRELEFLPNKVNVITGRSNTGKTAIMDIIDYCFFASKSKISESTINENASWYCLEIVHDDSLITFARKAPILSQVSNEYF